MTATTRDEAEDIARKDCEKSIQFIGLKGRDAEIYRAAHAQGAGVACIALGVPDSPSPHDEGRNNYGLKKGF
jgi:hypothetical protein